MEQFVLGDFVSLQYGKLPPKENTPDGEYPIFTGYRIAGYGKTYLFADPEVVVVARGVGGTGDVKISPPFSYVTNLSIVLQPIKPLNKYFLRDYLSLANLRQLDSGAAQSMITIDSLKRFPVKFPTLEIQNRIAEILVRYEDLIENNRRRIALLEESARLLYREWFVNLRFPGYATLSSMNGVPAGWRKVPISEQTIFLNRGITPAYNDSSPGLVINQKCIREGRLSMMLARRQSKEVKPERLIQVGDVLINSTGAGTLGRVAQVRSPVENCTVDTHVTIARPLCVEWATYFGQALLSLEPTFAGLGKGATNQLELNRADIGSIEIWCPPLSLVQNFHERVWPMLEQAENLLLSNRKLADARDELRHKLMSGEIEV